MSSSIAPPLTVDLPKLLETHGEHLIQRLLSESGLSEDAKVIIRRVQKQYQTEAEKLADRGLRASNAEYNQWISAIFDSVDQGCARDELIDDFIKRMEHLIERRKSDALFALAIEQITDGKTPIGYRLRQHCGPVHARQWENFESVIAQTQSSNFLNRLFASEEAIPLTPASSIKDYDGIFDSFVRAILRETHHAPQRDVADSYWLTALSLLSQNDAEPRRALFVAYRNIGTVSIPNPGRGAGQETRMLDILRIAYGQIDHQALVLNQNLAQQRQEWIRSLAPSVYAHDFVAPLNMIRNHCQIAQLFLLDLVPSISTQGTPDQQNKLATALDAMADMTHLVGRFYQAVHAYASLETTEHAELWTFDSVLQLALGLTQARSDKLGVALRMDKDSKKIWLSVDRTLVLIVLVNVLQNALDAIERERREKPSTTESAGSACIEMALRLSENLCEILIANTGSPIPRELWARIFKKGFTTNKAGHGMGLYLCRQICELLGGTLELIDLSDLRQWQLRSPCCVGFVLKLPRSVKKGKTPRQSKRGAALISVSKINGDKSSRKEN